MDLKWKGAMRQLQNEAQDLRFLVEQKEIRIKKQEAELSKMKNRLDKTMAKLYYPSQDEVVEGLNQEAGWNERQTNILNGVEQNFDITHPLQKEHHDISGVVKDGDLSFTQGRGRTDFGHREEMNTRMKEWADEVRKADDRCEFFRKANEDLQRKKNDIENRF